MCGVDYVGRIGEVGLGKVLFRVGGTGKTGLIRQDW